MPFQKINTKFPVLTVLLVGIVAAGCTSKPLAPEDKNLYDGKWVAKIGETYPRQHRGGWKLFCQNMQGELAFEVVDGVMTTALLGDTVQVPISANGKFKIVEPSEFRARSLGSSRDKLFDGRVTNTLRGRLNGKNPKGALDNWIQEAVSGCTTSVRFVRVDSSNSNAAPNLQAQFENFNLRGRNFNNDLD